jgi:hypothetical protein
MSSAARDTRSTVSARPETVEMAAALASDFRSPDVQSSSEIRVAAAQIITTLTNAIHPAS